MAGDTRLTGPFDKGIAGGRVLDAAGPRATQVRNRSLSVKFTFWLSRQERVRVITDTLLVVALRA